MEVNAAVQWSPPGARQHQSIIHVDAKRPASLRGDCIQEALDRFTKVAGESLEVPAVCVVLLGADGQLFASSHGLPLPTALLVSYAFRKHVTASPLPLVVDDGRRDPMVARNPAVRDGTVRACVGIPLRTAVGRLVGTLLAMDQTSRLWLAPQLDLLRTLGTLVVNEMESISVVHRASTRDVSSASVPVGAGPC